MLPISYLSHSDGILCGSSWNVVYFKIIHHIFEYWYMFFFSQYGVIGDQAISGSKKVQVTLQLWQIYGENIEHVHCIAVTVILSVISPDQTTTVLYCTVPRWNRHSSMDKPIPHIYNSHIHKPETSSLDNYCTLPIPSGKELGLRRRLGKLSRENCPETSATHPFHISGGNNHRLLIYLYIQTIPLGW